MTDTCESKTYEGPDSEKTVIEGTCTDKAGNTGQDSVEIKYDATKPDLKINASSNGQPYNTGTWTNNDVSIEFVCIDETSGIESYSNPVTLSNEGKNQAAKGTCMDKAGNKTTVEINNINIDKTTPEIEITYNLKDFDTQIKGKDNLSNTKVDINKSKILQPKYSIIDEAGNSIIVNTGKIKIGKQVALTLKNIQYNKDQIINLGDNVYFTLAIIDRSNKINQLDQYFAIKEDKKIFSNYTSSKNLTKIYTKNAGDKNYTSLEKPGIVELKIETEKGKLIYNY